MKLFQKPLQRKLSAVLGAQVTFERLNISLLGGSLDAHGVVVAGDDADSPVLTIKRVRAEVSLASALKGEIVVRSLTIERPVFSLVRRADGRTNLPKPMHDHFPADVLPDDSDGSQQTEDESSAEKGDVGRWRLDINKILLLDGEAHYRADRDGRDGTQAGYHASAEKIMADVTHREDSFDVTVLVESIGRRDRNAELGQIKLTGKFTDVEDLSRIADAGVSANLEVGDYIKAKVDADALRLRAFEFEASGAADLGRLSLFIPPDVPALARFERSHARGNVNFTARGSFDPSEGVRIPEFRLDAADVAVGGPAR